ncbi:MAG: hypothetical protein ACNYPE_02730 [Candidatus Azotimanducaceae bacterium WSBS_2022_MAG_OTU7]
MGRLYRWPEHDAKSTVVVPIGKSNAGLPLALQVIGRQRADLSVLQAMHRFEQVLEFTEVAAVGVVD